MKAILVFDNFNDLVYSNCCRHFLEHVTALAITRGLAAKTVSNETVELTKGPDADIVMQLFSPLVASQRFMKEQFRNAYSSAQCEDGTNVVFASYLGFMFLRIGNQEVAFLQREIQVCITLVTCICGPDVRLLKTSQSHEAELTSLLRTWSGLQAHDKMFLIEALQQPSKSPQMNSSLIKSLEDISSRVRCHSEGVHSLLFARTKLISWYSNKTAHAMAPRDVLILLVICESLWPHDEICVPERGDCDEFADLLHLPNANETEYHHRMLYFNDGTQFVPYVVHIGRVHQDMQLVVLAEHRFARTVATFCTMTQLLVDFRDAKREEKRDKGYCEMLDKIARTALENLKKNKSVGLKNEFTQRWERFKAGLLMYFKTGDSISVQPNPVIDILLGACRMYLHGEGIMDETSSSFKLVWEKIRAKSVDTWSIFTNISAVNADWFSDESRDTIPLSLYPGLLFYIYVDRNNHTMLVPSSSSEGAGASNSVSRQKIWNMVKFTRAHLLHGHFSIMWKDSTFNYSYFLWFEDTSGNSIAPGNSATVAWTSEAQLSIPGIFCGDFYKKLIDDCFPDTIRSKIRCKELYCVHQGSVTSSIVLEHSKRLAAHIKDTQRSTCMVDVL